MKRRILKVLLLVGLSFLLIPQIVWTQPGGVLNPRLRKSYPNLTQAFSDPALLPGDTLLVVRTVTEPGPVIIPPGWFGTIIGSPAMPGTIQQSAPGTCDPVWGGGVNCLIDARLRGGLVRILGLRFRVPNGATGIQAIGWPGLNPNPLTIAGCHFQGATSAAFFNGIVVGALGGAILIEKNIISGNIGDTAIAVVGNDTTPVNVQIRMNQITIVNANDPPTNGLGIGIGLTGIVGGTVLVERNRIVGGGATADALAGIVLAPFFTIPTTNGAGGAIIRRNTILNFLDATVTTTPFPPQRGTGIAIDTSPGVQILANLIKDNADGVAVDPLTANSSAGPPPPQVNDNNITCTNVAGCVAAGARGVVLNPGTYNLNAENNWWGTATGPGGTGCPGTGLPVVPACGTAAGQVDVTPFRGSPNPQAGA
jgi:hypothetical protein